MAHRVFVAAAALGASWGVQGTMVHSQGPDSLPQLPAIEAVLTKADGKAVDFAAQAMAMQKMVEESQRKGRDALAAQKADYEHQLTQQAAENQAVMARNNDISDQINHVQKENGALHKDAVELQAGNNRMRKMLQQISEKVDAADVFISESLRLTDDSTAEELNVLVPTTPRPTLSNFLEQAGTSLLQISKPNSGSSTPEDLVQVLSHSLGDIAEAQKEGAAELKAHFLTNFEESRTRHQELLAQQESLNATLAGQLAYQKDLTEAKNHLISTRDSLKQRLTGLRIFARKLDQTAHDALGGDAVAATDGHKTPHNLVRVQQAPPATTTVARSTTATTTVPASAPVAAHAPKSAPPAVEKAKQHIPQKETKLPKASHTNKVAALVEASSKTKKGGPKVQHVAKPAATAPAAVPSQARAAPTTKPPANASTSEQQASSNQPASRLQSWFAAWR